MYRKRLFARLPTTESDVFPLEFVLAGTNRDCCKSGIIIFTTSSHGHALRDGEISKFARSIGGKKAKSKKSTQITMSGDDIIGNLHDQGFTFLPVPVSPYSLKGSIMAERSIFPSVPRGVSTKASEIWCWMVGDLCHQLCLQTDDMSPHQLPQKRPYLG